MKSNQRMSGIMIIGLLAVLLAPQAAQSVLAQTPQAQASGEKRAERAQSQGQSQAQAEAAAPSAADDARIFEEIYLNFYRTYRLGAGDELAVRVVGQPDYTVEKARVSPVGRIYHPALGDVEVAGLTVDEVTTKLTEGLREYLINPRVSISLLETNSAKVGVLGEVVKPGIVVMPGPMTVLDAIAASGGFTQFSSRSDVQLVRLGQDGRMRTIKVNAKQLLEGKADNEENPTLKAGDTVIVNGNKKKTLSYLASLASFSSFIAFLTLGR